MLEFFELYLFVFGTFKAFYAHTAHAAPFSIFVHHCLLTVVIYQPVNSLESHTHSGFSQQQLGQGWFVLY